MADLLIVEDEPSINDLIAMNLKLVGHHCEQVYTGQAAVDYLKDNKPDLVLLDVMLPEQDGFSLLQSGVFKDIPVILVTARSQLYDRVKGLNLGADDYIVKPFEVLELLVRIEKTLERAGKLRQVLEVGRLTINLLERSVRIDGTEILLKPMEFDLLVMLAKNKNIALSRERLLHGVWGVDFQGETRTVDVHVQTLRQKLAAAGEGADACIQTVRGVGYCIKRP